MTSITPRVITPSTPSGSYTANIIPPQPIYGTFLKPFSASSRWNCKPTNPVFDNTFIIPKDSYAPVIGAGSLSVGAFKATAQDGPMTVFKDPSKNYIRCADSEQNKQSITIPHWPVDATPASGGDGHCDIVDESTGIIHSFWQLRKQQDGKFTAVFYAWTRLDGSGWGNPAHYYQGARAAAVVPIAGIIRKHEVDDGKDIYEHALAMSLCFSGLGPSPAYTYPATHADTYANILNKGKIPEGALLMLPADFDLNTISDVRIRKVAKTLKTYGAYIVDQNEGTPFFIYVESGSGYNLHNVADGWNEAAMVDLDKIRLALRQVLSAKFIGGDGKEVLPESNPNLLSMRGDWVVCSGACGEKSYYNTWKQAVVIPPTPAPVEVVDGNNKGYNKVSWAKIVVGGKYKITVKTTGGGKMGVFIWNGSTCKKAWLNNGESYTFDWIKGSWFEFRCKSAGGNVEATVSATLVKI